MNIRPSAAIRQNYNEIASYCKETGEPVYLTRNGEGELVVMDIERDRLAGATYYTLDELDQAMTDAIRAAQEDINA